MLNIYDINYYNQVIKITKNGKLLYCNLVLFIHFFENTLEMSYKAVYVIYQCLLDVFMAIKAF